MVAMAPWLVWTLVGVASSSIAGVVLQKKKDHVNRFFMRILRDIGRHKAYKRRYGGNRYALSTFLFQKEGDPLLGLMVDDKNKNINNDNNEEQQQWDDHDLPTYTMQELWELGYVDDFAKATDDEPRKLLLSVFGYVYDVTKGVKFYGPGASYHMFCGRDVTYALSTGCSILRPSCEEEGRRGSCY